jgi:1,4-dihydroxy-2-naphthoate octaprenyltransferase
MLMTISAQFNRLLTPKVRAWYQAARPRSLTATYVPIGLAGAIALGDGMFDLARFILCLVAALSLQIAANLINEYVDFVRGSDAGKVAGMGMVIKENVLTPREVLIGAIVMVLMGIIIGLYLVTQSGVILIYIGIVGVLIVILYTAGPLPLAYIGLGEAAVFIAMGPLMVLGAYYVMAGGAAASPFLVTPVLAAMPIGCTIANILHANNLRDLEADRAANKWTLAARFGLKFARSEYIFWMFAAYTSLIGLIAVGWIPWICLVTMATIPDARRLIETAVATTDSLALHRLQGRTARFHRDFGLAIVLSWATYVLVRDLLLSIR